jgi:hypothetical protein
MNCTRNEKIEVRDCDSLVLQRVLNIFYLQVRKNKLQVVLIFKHYGFQKCYQNKFQIIIICCGL